jgi:hypothetical protein
MQQWKNCEFLLSIMVILTCILLPVGSIPRCESTSPTFSTWDIFEVDKLASIWLIKRFIAPDAIIKLYPKGEAVMEGIPFDTPDAKFRRYHNASTYEMIRRHYNIDDPRCIYISKIVHDIEINTWEKKVISETRPVIDAIQKITTNSSSSEEIISKGIIYFDELYTKSLIEDSGSGSR